MNHQPSFSLKLRLIHLWPLLLLLIGAGVFWAEAAEPVPSISATREIPPTGTTGVFARILAIDSSRNMFTASNGRAAFVIRCSSNTLSRAGGTVVKASDLKAGADVMVRGRVEPDGSVSAIFVSSRLPVPTAKPASSTGSGKAPATGK